MKTAAIIAEYNPFHNGHSYQLEEVRKRSGADYLIVLMSGDFVQRGTPALFDKYVRTEAALAGGADLILELPLRFAAGSAARFADGAVSVLDGLGMVDELWFGSEEGEPERFSELAEILLREPEGYRSLLKAALKTGLSYPAARSEALSRYCGKDLDAFLKAPNNILGLEYVLALKKRNSGILPWTLKRRGSGYHAEQVEGSFSSATAIRTSLLSGELTVLDEAVPEHCRKLYKEKISEGSFVTEADLSEALRYQLWKESEDSLKQVLDVSEELANRIIRLRPEFRDFSSFAAMLQTRNQTGTAMQRALLHILLGITKEETFISSEMFHCGQSGESFTDLPEEGAAPAQLIRMLGISRAARSGGLLSGISKKGPIAVTANPGTHPLGEQYSRELSASCYYQSLACRRSGRTPVHEYSRKLIVM